MKTYAHREHEHSARVERHSVSPDGVELVSFLAVFPRIILAEVNTHRMLSRNSASSRAIPTKRMIEKVVEHPYIPSVWGKNQPGMSAVVEMHGEEAADCERKWLFARDASAAKAMQLASENKLHKQTVNRLLEPWLFHTALISGTEWDNFFHQRIHPSAHPDFQIVAKLMKEALDHSTSEMLYAHEWHLPFIDKKDLGRIYGKEGKELELFPTRGLTEAAVISVARSARTSYENHDGVRDLRKDFELYQKLLTQGHMSPFEHVARPAIKDDTFRCFCRPSDVDAWGYVRPRLQWHGNFRGWVQARKFIAFEEDPLKPKGD